MEPLVVKVCDTNDIGVHNSALNESRIMQQLNCAYISKFTAFYEDQQLNKSYLVMEYAGARDLNQFVHEMRTDHRKNQKSISEVIIKSVMTMLF